MIPAELVPFLESGLSTYVGSASSEGRPLCMRGTGIKVREHGRVARVYLPVSCAEPTLVNLRSNPRVAVTLSRPETHRTVQVKGPVLAILPAAEAERVVMEELFQAYARECVFLGVPRAVLNRVNRWPCWAVDFEPADVFIQTPGPLAGARIQGDAP